MAHTRTNILIHAVYSTKDRHPFLTEPTTRDELFAYMGGILRNNRAQPLGVNGFVEHVHMLFALHPDCTLAHIIKESKRASSIWIKRKGDRYQKFCWQAGYCALSVSDRAKPMVKKYIENQVSHHQKVTFREEWEKIMRAHEFPLREGWGK